MADQPRIQHFISGPTERADVSPFLPIAEDIEWLNREWLVAQSTPSREVLRRGSGTLRLLLCDRMVHRAWHYHGLEGAPTVVAPDLEALTLHRGHEFQYAASLIAGGAYVDGLHFSMIGAWRVDNLTTGISRDAEEGFAVEVSSIARDARGDEGEHNELTAMVDREWRLGAYLKAPGAVRRGQPISRQLIIEFFANYAGGVHLDQATADAKPWKRALYELVAELEHRVAADKIDGLYFELLAIGQAIGGSPTLQGLAAAIRRNDRPAQPAEA